MSDVGYGLWAMGYAMKEKKKKEKKEDGNAVRCGVRADAKTRMGIR